MPAAQHRAVDDVAGVEPGAEVRARRDSGDIAPSVITMQIGIASVTISVLTIGDSRFSRCETRV